MNTRSYSSILVTTLFSLAISAAVLAQERSQIADSVTGKESAAAKQHLRYKLIDLGTFGGPSSYLATTNGVTGPGAINRVLNNQGTIAGWADTSGLDPFAPNCLGLDCFLPRAFEGENGVLTGLALLPGGDGSTAAWISDNGLIAGQARNGLVDPLLPGVAEIRAVLWKKGKALDLGTLGGNESSAFSVNNRGQVVGVATNTIPDPSSFWATQLRAFLWKDGVMQDLGTLGGPEAFGLFVNERGQVAGIATTNSSPSSGFFCGLLLTYDPFVWENGKMTDLGTLGGTCGTPFALNNRGQVIGISNLPGDLVTHPFLWERGSLIDLGTFGGNFGFAFGINESGEVVGFATNKNDQADLAFRWKDGVLTNLGTLDGDDCSHAFQINSKGQIVGISFPCAGGPPRLVLWRNGFMTDLSVFAPPGSTLTPWFDGAVINDGGEIASVRVLPDGDLHAFMLVPCEEDTDSCMDAVEGAAATLNISARAVAAWTAPSVSLSPTSLTFPTQAIGTTSAAGTVALKNTGTTSLTISSIAITGTDHSDFAQTHSCGSSLTAGASCNISVTFTPTASGTRTAMVSVTDNASRSPQKISLAGIGTTAKLSPTGVSFYIRAIGVTASPKIVTLTNVAKTTLTIGGFAITGANAGDFSQTHTCGTSLAAGASCSISVWFKPTAKGKRTAVLSVMDNAAGSPQQVALWGWGVYLVCQKEGEECYGSHPCCPGLQCVALGNRDFCEAY